MSEIAFLPATEQARLVRDKEVSPVELVTTYLERIEKFDQTLNSFVTVAADQALDGAAKAEQKVAEGDDLPPFHGVPISIKDLNDTAGIRTTYSSRVFAEHVPNEDASTVRRLKDAGFIVLGKTNTPEWGTIPLTESELNGVCRNPWDTERTPGGSSGGAAAALAAGLSPIAQGSDGGGSIRIPSSCCGLFGIKPTRGRVSHAPRFGETLAGLSTDGPIARTVRDAAAMLDIISGYEVGDPYWAESPERPFEEEVGAPPGKLRIGFTIENPLEVPVDDECVRAVEDAAKLLESLGHSVEHARPHWDDPNATSYFVQVWASAYAFHPVGLDTLEPLNRTLAELALDSTAIDYVQAEIGMQNLARRVVAFWNDYDLLLTPTLALPPVPVGWIFEEEDPWAQFTRSGLFAAFTPMVNTTGQPGVSVPLHWSEDGLPIGVHLVGRPADEATLIRVSAQLEEAKPWADKRPPVS